MNIHDYRKKYLKLKQAVLKAQQDLATFKEAEHRDFYELYRQKQNEDLNWFVEHIDYIQRHKEYIKKSDVLSKIVIDFMPLYVGGGLASGCGFSINSSGYKIFLGDLLDLWDKGFCYEGYPIVFCELGIHWGTTYIIKYLKNKQIETVKQHFKGQQWFLPEIGEEVFKCLKKANINSKFEDLSTYRTIDLIHQYTQTGKI